MLLAYMENIFLRAISAVKLSNSSVSRGKGASHRSLPQAAVWPKTDKGLVALTNKIGAD